MEETVASKRPRDEETEEEEVGWEEYSKRHKPYNHILSLLESEEEESTQDLSPLISTLQQEITCSSNSDTLSVCPAQEQNDQNILTISNNAVLEDCTTSNSTFSSPHNSDGLWKELHEENDKEGVMRHILQASDDELGIPNRGDEGLLNFGEFDGGFNIGYGFSSLCDKLWELEDEKANYYALLQSELFL